MFANLQSPHLSLYALRFHLVAQQPLWFSQGKAGNTLRGALGQANLLATDRAHSERFTTAPKPFVIRAAHLDGKYLTHAEPFWFDLHLFDRRLPAILGLIETIQSWQTLGLGATRSEVKLESVSNLLRTGAEQALTLLSNELLPVPLHLPLRQTQDDEDATRLTVHFVTPTELKADGKVTPLPSFAVLITRIEERIRSLCTAFGSVPLQLPASDWFEQAKQVNLIEQQIEHVSVRRRSSRTGQTHPIGGFTGWIQYEGAIGRYLPLLQAAYWTGVGRQTSWGKGVITLKLSRNRYD